MNSKKTTSGVVAGILLPMGLICLFAFCSLTLALLGGNAYRQIQGGIEDSYGSTVCANYLLTKLSQNNATGQITLRQEGDVQLLVIATVVQERDYETRIYYDDGQLKETLVSADTPFKAQDGMTVANVKNCTFSLSDSGLFTADIESPGGEITRTVFALAGGGAT